MLLVSVPSNFSSIVSTKFSKKSLTFGGEMVAMGNPNENLWQLFFVLEITFAATVLKWFIILLNKKRL